MVWHHGCCSELELSALEPELPSELSLPPQPWRGSSSLKHFSQIKNTCSLMESFPPMIISLIIFPFRVLGGNRYIIHIYIYECIYMRVYIIQEHFPRSTLAVTKRTGFDHVAFQGHHFCCTWLVQGWSCWGDCGVGSWLLWGPSIPQSGMWWGKGQSQLRRGCWRQLHDKSNGITNTSVLEISTHFSFLLRSSQNTRCPSATISYVLYYIIIYHLREIKELWWNWNLLSPHN